MKIGKTIVTLLIIMLITSIATVKAVDYSSVSLSELSEIKDDDDLLNTVKQVIITNTDDLSLTYLLSKCHNIESLVIKKAEIDDLTFINDIVTNKGFSLEIRMGYYNMDGISNDYVNRITVESSYVTNFSDGMDFPNTSKITIEYVSGYEDIDYSIYSNLNALSLYTIAVSDYESFFGQLKTLNNFKALNLINTNITDNDTKYLKEINWIENLNLEKCFLSDISFLEEMSEIKYLYLPLNVTDLSVIKKLPNLKYVYWSGYEQLALTDDLVQYLDDHNISHNKYDSTLKTTLLNMVNEINVNDNMTIKEKIEKVIDYMTMYIESHDTFYDEEYTTNSLLYITHFKRGVCNEYSILEHALLKLMGIDSYYIGGLHPIYMNERDGSFSTVFVDDLQYELAGHAWLMAQDENGTWFGWDPSQIDIYYGEPGTEGFFVDNINGKKINFWKNPYEDDSYTYSEYINNGYATFNYNFAKRHVVTNKIGYDDYLRQKNQKSLSNILTSNNYNISDNYVLGFTIGMTVQELKSKLGDNDINITTNDDIVATGSVISMGNENYTIIIKGDNNGDGIINSGDLLQVRKHLLNMKSLENEFFIAGDVNDDNIINSGDLLKLRKHLLGMLTIS